MPDHKVVVGKCFKLLLYFKLIKSTSKYLGKFLETLIPRPHVAGYFSKRRLFPPYLKKKFASSRSVFARPHQHDTSPFQQSPTCARKRSLRVDGSRILRRNPLISKITGYVWTGGQTRDLHERLLPHLNTAGSLLYVFSLCKKLNTLVDINAASFVSVSSSCYHISLLKNVHVLFFARINFIRTPRLRFAQKLRTS